METPAANKIVQSQNCMMEISKFLPANQLLEWQLINKKFYENVVPTVMRNRQMNPVIAQKIHLFLKDKAVYGMTLNDSHVVKEVDFEDDNWRHDSQYTVNEKVKLLFDMSKFEEVANDEEILPHYIQQLNANQFVVFPLREAVFLGRGLIV